ncbi:hypothetical protein FKG94_15495 [Exilibacterium tricleocarpae]|uniref:Uncharacterized protein n=1 Tax=Exilibacterium tricleocarpae TaxID=2591008 RepID=A0A545TFL7_9GAMM|nr:cation:proton antiporter family protein [Exilibacterium tricleocarpae]TQV76013.1 hypothetical protein FKG94_15495 [Exilibacterium tricleocarpae]
MFEPVVILLAFIAGMAFRGFGYPPLLGYLLAGFLAHEMEIGDATTITLIADLGITLLLFTIGLKLNLKELMAPQVWAVAGAQMAIVIPLTTLVIVVAGLVFPRLALPNTGAAWLLAFALSFSSTVFAVKIFDERGENASLHAAIAIGILIVQDLIAVTYLVVSSGKLPSLFALGLLALPLLRPVLIYLLRLAGHGELLVLFGIAAAVGTAELFEAVNLKGGLGALIVGVLLGNTEKTSELYKNLINFKDLFLIGFFLSVGYNGLPSGDMLLAAVALSLLIFLRPIIYFLLLTAFKLRARTALLAGLSLFNYSEFGLIVAALAAASGQLPPQWVTTLALAMALSFFISVPFNAMAHRLYARFSMVLHKFERAARLPEERQASLGAADNVVVGMGRVGSGAYQYLQELYPDNVVGVEESVDKAEQHVGHGIRCVHGDGGDQDFWEQANLSERKLILVCLTNHKENLEVVKLLRQLNFPGRIAVVSQFPDQQKELQALGCVTFNLYAEAGHGFAEHVLEQIG